MAVMIKNITRKVITKPERKSKVHELTFSFLLVYEGVEHTGPHICPE